MFNLSPIYSACKSSSHKLSINHKISHDTNLHKTDTNIGHKIFLGYTFTTKLSLCQGVSPLAAKGKKATYDCVRVLRKFSELTRQTFFKMFDVQIQPIVLYGSEVLGLQRIDVIEKVHTFACKRFSFF